MLCRYRENSENVLKHFVSIQREIKERVLTYGNFIPLFLNSTSDKIESIIRHTQRH